MVPISHQDMEEIREILAAPRREDLTPLIPAACETMKEAEQTDDEETRSEAHEQLHRGLLIGSGNRHPKNLGLRYRLDSLDRSGLSAVMTGTHPEASPIPGAFTCHGEPCPPR